MKELFALLGILVVLFLVLAASYYSTRLVGRYMLRTSGGMQGNFSVLRRLPLGREQHLMVVRVGERNLLLGCTSSAINLITELSPEESQAIVPCDLSGQAGQFPNFAQWFDRARAAKKDE